MPTKGAAAKEAWAVHTDAVGLLLGGRELRAGRRGGETLGRGDCFDEIALLCDQPRTATVRASADAHQRVSVLRRTAYLTAVTGYPASSAAGQEVVTARLKADAELLPAASDAH